jgi:hypothetical protein
LNKEAELNIDAEEYAIMTNIVKLKPINLTLKTALSRELFANTEINFEDFLDTLVITIRNQFLSEYLGTHIIKYPLNWIEAFKERWFPKYLKSLWPIKYKEHIISARVLYPNLKASLPDEPQFIKFIDEKNIPAETKEIH